MHILCDRATKDIIVFSRKNWDSVGEFHIDCACLIEIDAPADMDPDVVVDFGPEESITTSLGTGRVYRGATVQFKAGEIHQWPTEM